MDEIDRNRLQWRSRRGMLELDLFLLPFLATVLPGRPDLHAAYWRLLDEDDPTLLDWLSARDEPADGELRTLVRAIRLHARGPFGA